MKISYPIRKAFCDKVTPLFARRGGVSCYKSIEQVGPSVFFLVVKLGLLGAAREMNSLVPGCLT